MNWNSPTIDSLVLYKSGPARITAIEEKITILLPNGNNKRVREKDIRLLHPGPCGPLSSLTPIECEEESIQEAWELLDGESLPLNEVCELIYGDFTPHSAWSGWQLLQEDLYFHGTPEALEGYPLSRIESVRQQRNAKQEAQQQRAALLQRLRSGTLEPEDHAELSDVEMLALGRSEVSRILRDLGREQRPESAHQLLLECGYWEPEFNPYPARMGVETSTASGVVAELDLQEPRTDLTHLSAWAIDDEGNTDPDDAISLDGERIWVHIADVAALVKADSPLDLQARARGANLYLPEGTLTMLPARATELLGLGLNERSPALSIGFTLSAEATIEAVEIVTSWIRVQRTSYATVEQQIEQIEFAPLYQRALQYQQRRLQQGAIRLELPEVKIRVRDGAVEITPLPKLRSRDLVTEFMLMAGEAAAQFAQQQEIPFPYSTQPPPEPDETGTPYPAPQTAAEMYAFRRRFQRSQMKSQPDHHAGLGMVQYSQVTSPLRRYLDLVAHQQLRAWIRQEPLLDSEALTERVGAAEAVIGNIRRAERLSNRHWTLIWLRSQGSWSSEGVLVEQIKQRGTFLVPELALECRVRTKQPLALNETTTLSLREVDLPELTAYFRC
jgi:exoribonuclease-2